MLRVVDELNGLSIRKMQGAMLHLYIPSLYSTITIVSGYKTENNPQIRCFVVSAPQKIVAIVSKVVASFYWGRPLILYASTSQRFFRIQREKSL